MTLKDYIDIIKSSGVIKEAKLTLLVELFNATCTGEKATHEAAKKWLSKKRNIRVSMYFVNYEVSEGGFYDYFKRRITAQWRELQKAFAKTSIENSVDCETDNEIFFYRSLLVQFIMILGIPLPKHIYDEMLFSSHHDTSYQSMPSRDSSHLGNEAAPTNKAQIKQLLDVFLNLIYEYKIIKVLTADTLEPSNNILDFVEATKYEILNRFVRLQSEIIFLKIREFIFELENYYHLCFAASHSCTNVFEIMHDKNESSNTFGKSALIARKEIDSIYGEIFEGQTLFVC